MQLVSIVRKLIDATKQERIFLRLWREAVNWKHYYGSSISSKIDAQRIVASN
jgi:hypothetical protein